MTRIRSIVSWAFALSIAAALINANVLTVGAVIFMAWAFLIVEVEIHHKETMRQLHANRLAGMGAAGVNRNADEIRR